MNSTPRYSVRKIVSETICFVLSLETRDGLRHWVFANAHRMEKRKAAAGIEFGEDEIRRARRSIPVVSASDFCVSGIYALFYETGSKLRFTLPESPLLSGNYVLFCPSWGRRSARKMWLLIPTRGKG